MSAHLTSLGIRASAGTGKTYQLAQRYLALLALGEAAGGVPEAMVALTFTRKAAREFAQRILETLAEAAIDPTRAEALAGRIEQVWRGATSGGPGDDPVFGALPALVDGEVPLRRPDQAAFREMLVRVCAALDRLELTTLDSFFTRIARGFAYELGMAGFQLLDDAGLAAARAEVLGTLFDLRRDGRRGEDDLGEFATSLQLSRFGRDEVAWSQSLDQLLTGAQQAWWQLPNAEAWGAAPGSYRELSSEDLDTCLCRIRELARGAGIEESSGSKRGPQLRGTVIAFAEQLADGLSGSWSKSALVDGLREEGLQLGRGPLELTYYGKPVTIDVALAGELGRLFEHAVAVGLRTIRLRSRGIGRLMAEYEARYAAQVRRRGELGFAELGSLLAGLPVLPGVAVELARLDLEARLDARIEHWFLDEFQDTSRAQWAVLENWLDEVVTGDEGSRTLFVVGDPKQAVYGWRGGDAALFGELWQRPGWEGRFLDWGMSQSYRSAPAVLEMVNATCEDIDWAAFESTPAGLAESWDFPHHEAACPDLPGYAALWEFPRGGQDENEDNGEEVGDIDPRWLKAAELIVTAEVESRELSVAVIVRRVQTGIEAGDALRRLFAAEGREIAVEVEGEAALAGDSPLGLVLADLFRWLALPGDDFAWVHLKSGVLAPLVDRLGPARETVWHALWSRWMEGGPEAILGELAAAVDEDGLGAYQRARLVAWRELAIGWLRDGGGSLSQWRRVLEHATRREHAAGGSVEVLTVHKAKGLEWDLVIWVEPGHEAWDSVRHLDRLAGQHEDGSPWLLENPPAWLTEVEPELAARREVWAREQCLGGLCVGYVAMTRAVHALHVFVPELSSGFDSFKPGKGPVPRTDHWLRVGLDCLEPGPKEGAPQLLWESPDGDRDWYRSCPEQAGEGRVAIERPLGRTVPRLRRRSPSERVGTELPDTRRQGSTEGRHFGIELHRRAALLPLAGEVPAPVVWEGADISGEAVAVLRAAWADPALAWAWGSADEAGWELWTERGFEIVLGGEWISGVFDRVMLRRDPQGRPIEARLVEIKTDVIADAAELAGRHRTQLALYRRVLARLIDLEAEAIEARFLWLPRWGGALLVAPEV